MNQSGIIQAEQIFYPGWLMVSQLRSGQEVQDGKALYRKARQLVTQARDKLAEAGFSQANIDTMLYAFCALTRYRRTFLAGLMQVRSSGSVFASS